MVRTSRTKSSLAVATILALTSIACGVSLPPPQEDADDRPSDRQGGRESTANGAATDGSSSGSPANGGDGSSQTQTQTQTPPGSETTAPRMYAVFVSSKQFAANDLGGLTGADQKCKALADGSYFTLLHGKKWAAWLSDGTTSAVERLGSASGPWVLTDGKTIVAKDKVQLTGPSSLAHAIDEDEGAWWHEGDVWTGTLASGAGDSNCGGWMGTSGQGRVGSIVSSKPNWTARTEIGCGTGSGSTNDFDHYNPYNDDKPRLRIYCFEVD